MISVVVKLQQAFKLALSIFKFLLGEFQVNYKAPDWLKGLWNKFNRSDFGKRGLEFFTKIYEALQKNPARTRKLIAGATAFGLFAVIGYFGVKRYLDSLPKPSYVTYEVHVPTSKNLETNELYPLKIEFNRSAAKLDDLNKIIKSGVQIKPEIQGEWLWISDTVLQFMPLGIDKIDAPSRASIQQEKVPREWGIGVTYKIQFEKSFFPDQVLLEKYKVEFETVPLKFTVIKNEFYVDPRNPSSKKVLVNLSFNYPIDSEDIKKRINFLLKDEAGVGPETITPFSVSFNKFLNEVYLQSNSLPVPKKNQKMIVKIDKGIKALREDGQTEKEKVLEVSVPGIFDAFKISRVSTAFARNDKYEPEQILVVETSVEVKSEEILQKLKLKILPSDRPALDGEKKITKDYAWQSVEEITKDIATKMKDVDLKLVPSEREFSKIHTFKFQTEPRRYLHVVVNSGVKSLGDYELLEKYESLLSVGDYPQELTFMGNGTILSVSGDLKLPLIGRNNTEVQFEIARILPEQTNHLMSNLSQGYSDIKTPNIDEMFEDSIAEKFEHKIKLKIESAAATQYFSLDLEPFLNKMGQKRGLFIIKAKGIGRQKYAQVSDRRLIFTTDLGILLKETVSRKAEVFIQNFRTGAPVEGAQVDVLGKNGVSVLSLNTDKQGHLTLPDLKEFRREKEAVAIVAKKGADASYLPLKNGSRYLQFSRFDVSGVYESASSDELMSMMFSDRGLYRPGEKVNLGLIVRSKTGKKAFAKLPVLWKVIDPRGNEIFKESIEVNSSDLKSLDFKTEETSATGVYKVQMLLVKKHPHRIDHELIGSLDVRIEEFMPDRLKISTRLENSKLEGWIKPQELKAMVKLANLFGTAAEKRLVRASYTLIPVSPYFRTFKEYRFTNPNRADVQTYTEQLSETKTSESGEAEFLLDLNKYNGSLYQLSFEAEGFESEGGRGVHALSSVWVSPFEFLIGAKPDGELDYIKKDSIRNLDLIAISSDLKRVEAKEIKVEVLERKYVSVLTQQSDGTFRYQSVLREKNIETKKIEVGEKGYRFKLKTDEPGDFAIIFRNSEKGELLHINYSVAGSGNLTRQLERNAELQLSLNKKDFKPGEEIEMQVKAPYHGSGLITIERDGVYAFKWFKTNQSATVEKIKIPEGLEGNAYVNVAFIRALDSKEIFMSPLSYAVAPFSISLEQHKTQISLKVPEIIKPGEKLKITYSADRKTGIILYGVDEGILQVAKYQTPDPLNYFFQKRALQVRTYQLVDLLLPEFSIVQQMQASGGDEGFKAIGKNLNPFKSRRAPPVVFWSGVIQADEKEKTFTYVVPDYFNGNMKIMAVSSAEAGLGSITTSALIRGDFIISPTAPVFVAPTDEFVLGVGISNQLTGSGPQAKVKLKAQTSEHLAIMEAPEKTIEIPEGREGSSSFRIKSTQRLGEASVTLIASSEGKSAKSKTEISVRPATPYTHIIDTGWASKLPLEKENKSSYFKEFAKANLSFSTLPLVLSQGISQYLESYPYGCTEQLISKSFPALILGGRKQFALNFDKLKDIHRLTIQTLRSRQSGNGGFALYNSRNEQVSPMASLYAIHYLIESRERHQIVPDDMLDRSRKYLTYETHKFERLTDLRRWSYALYLRGRMGIVDGAATEELHKILIKNFSEKWEKDSTAIFLAATLKLYKQDELALSIIKRLRVGEYEQFDYEDYQDGRVRDANLVYVLAKHFPEFLKEVIDQKSLKVFTDFLTEGTYNTHSSAWTILALEAMAAVSDENSILSDVALEVGNMNSQNQLEFSKVSPIKKSPLVFQLNYQHKKIRAIGDLKFPLFYLYYRGGFPIESSKLESKKGIEVQRLYTNKTGNPIDKVQRGDEVYVHLRVRSLDQKNHPHIAVVDLVPGGFDMVINSLTESGIGGGSNGFGEGGDSSENSDSDGDSSMPSPRNEEGGEDGTPDGNSETSEEGAQNLINPMRLLLNIAYAQTAAAPQLRSLYPEFVDSREDRVLIFTSISPELGEYNYRIKAVNEGKFITPPAFAESMYDKSLQYVGTAGIIEVQ